MGDPQLDLRKIMLEEIVIQREPSLELAKLTHGSCKDFAQNLIKSGMLLNGGAIVALPAIANIFFTDFSKIKNLSDIKTLLFIAVCWYVLGLVAAWLTGIVAYFAACVHNRASLTQMWKVHNDHYKNYGLITQEAYEKFEQPTQLSLPKDEAAYTKLRNIGILLSFSSLLFFIVGSTYSGIAFMKIAGI